MHRMVMGWAPVLAVPVGTKAAIEEGHDRLCYLETSQPWYSLTAARPEKQKLWRGPPVRTEIRKLYSIPLDSAMKHSSQPSGGAGFLVGKMLCNKLERGWMQHL